MKTNIRTLDIAIDAVEFPTCIPKTIGRDILTNFGMEYKYRKYLWET